MGNTTTPRDIANIYNMIIGGNYSRICGYELRQFWSLGALLFPLMTAYLGVLGILEIIE